jgi:SPP1 family predicted phage head-tail adaptor
MKQILHVESPVVRNELLGEPGGEYERTGVREWFDVRPLTGREYSQAQQMQSNVTHELKCVYFDGARSGMRLTAGDDAENPTRIFNIESIVNESENNRFLVLRAVEVT